MAGKIRGITIELDGDTTKLDKALTSVNKTSRDLSGELKQVERGLKFDPGNVELLRQKQEILNESIENTSKKLKVLKDSQEQVEAAFQRGDLGADQYRAFQRELEQTEGQLKAFKRQADSVDAKIDVQADTSGIDKMKSAIKELPDEAKQAGREIGQALGTGAAAIAAGAGALVLGTNELNTDLARLRTNASLASADLDLVEQAFQDIVTVTGEADSAVETVSNLLASGFEDNQLEQVIEGINGAAIRFSDTLKTEGIADGIQETFATGEAIGMFAELLERSGVNLETFNAELAIAKQNGTEADLVMQTMAELGLTQVTEKYKELNPEVAANAEATANFEKSMADLGLVLTPLIVTVTNFITKLVEWAEQNPGLTKAIVIMAGAVAGVTGALMIILPIIGNVIKIVGSWSAIMKVAAAVVAALTSPIGLTVAAIVGLIAIGVALYKNWDIIMAKAGELARDMSVKFAQVKSAITGKIAETISAVKDKVASFKSIGSSIITGLISGVGSMAGRLITKVKDTIGDAVGAAKRLLGINSPSRVFMEIGRNTGEGMAIGMEDTVKKVQKAGRNMVSASIPDVNKIRTGLNAANNTPRQPIIVQTQLNGRTIAEEVVQDVNKLQGIGATMRSLSRGVSMA